VSTNHLTSDVDIQKKYAGAKAISSDMLFGQEQNVSYNI
jgi:hypothetical protein